MLELQNKIETLRKWHTLGIIQVTRLYEEQFRLMLIGMENEVNKNFIKSVLPTELSLEEILREAVRRKVTYSIQYADYDMNTWTAPVDLTENRMQKLLDDGSIRKVRLELEF